MFGNKTGAANYLLGSRKGPLTYMFLNQKHCIAAQGESLKSNKEKMSIDKATTVICNQDRYHNVFVIFKEGN